MGPTYYNTFIEVAKDCPVTVAEIPPDKGEKKTKANLEFELIAGQPYHHTGEDIAFLVHAMYNEIPKGQPCLRTSALSKRYGWGTHHNENGKIALVPMESREYKKFAKNASLKHLKAMRSKKG